MMSVVRNLSGRWAARCAALALAGISLAPAWADSWALPETKTYLSANTEVRLTVVPRSLESQFAFFEGKVKGQEPAGPAAGADSERAGGTLERRLPNGEWSLVWRTPLLNEVAPVSALVANDGDHVVTFDNWHSIGYGDNVIVIYGPEGQVVRSLGLHDFLSPQQIKTLPASISSVRWAKSKSLSADGQSLHLEIARPDDESLAFIKPTQWVDIDLDTGDVSHRRTWPLPVALGVGAAVVVAGLLTATLSLRRRRSRGP